MRAFKLFALSLFLFIALRTSAQDTLIISDKLSTKYLGAISKKANELENKLDRKSQSALTNFKKHELKLLQKVKRIDSLAAKNIFSNTTERHKQLEEKLRSSNSLSQYIPRLDTISTSLKFLQQNAECVKHVKDAKEKLADASKKLSDFKDKLKNAEDIKQFLRERRQYLKEQLEKFGFTKELKKINKEVYYYSEQIKEYKELFKDPAKAERKAIELLSKTKLFQDFMRKNSLLASLFRMPGDPNDPAFRANLAGLQTRAQVSSLIQNQLAAGGTGSQQAFQQNIQQARTQLQQVKEKINNWGGGSSDDIMPEGFKPNDQKTKSLWKRIELGTNIQSQRATNFYPITTDIGISVGYKLNDKSIFGFGGSYKLGWGKGWNNIHITHQGIGLRSFVDLKLKGSIWISGGYEQNYKTEIRNIDQLKDRSAWQQSGLLGISKTLPEKSKFFKSTKTQLLWDFLSYRQVPRSQAILFRLGYNIN